MSFLVVQGDARQIPLADESVSCCITSPPYYGLRQYGHWAMQSVWGSLDDFRPPRRHRERWLRRLQWRAAERGGIFSPNGKSWIGALGLEPTIERYVANMVTVFREVKRVLHRSGVLFLNLGDSYSGSWGNYSGQNRGNGKQRAIVNGSQVPQPSYDGLEQWRPATANTSSSGLKNKDLCMIPARVALALQADGWFLRSMIPFVKRKAMPESVQDRPSSAIEYIFMFTKSEKYYYDSESVKSFSPRGGEIVPLGAKSLSKGQATGAGIAPSGNGKAAFVISPQYRNRRNSDWFFESWQGLLGDEDGDPLALVVNPSGFSGAHFATFPPKLVEPLIKAGSPKDGIVLDPFGGAGTVALVANKLGRNAICLDLSLAYCRMARDRITADAPLLHWGETAPVAITHTQSDLWNKE